MRPQNPTWPLPRAKTIATQLGTFYRRSEVTHPTFRTSFITLLHTEIKQDKTKMGLLSMTKKFQWKNGAKCSDLHFHEIHRHGEACNLGLTLKWGVLPQCIKKKKSQLKVCSCECLLTGCSLTRITDVILLLHSRQAVSTRRWMYSRLNLNRF